MGQRVLKPATRYAIITAAGLLTALTLAAGAQNGPAIPDLDPADCSNGTFIADPDTNPGLVADCRALVSIRNHWTRRTEPTDSDLLTWGTGDTAPITAWAGIGINDQRVEHLDLSYNGLTGPIPAELAQLTNLTLLDLSGNELTGIPAQLAQLTNLNELNLYYNRLTGTIPTQLAQLTNLTWLNLNYNELTGTIPAQLAQLTNLEQLNLNNNELTGPIPPQLAQLTNLTELNLNNNELTGPISPQLTQLTNLERLDLSFNKLTGTIPAQLAQLTNLTWLDLSGNRLTGTIPAQLAQLTNLFRLFLGGSELTGTIPAQLAQLTNLTILFLGDSELTGTIPPELAQLTNLTWLDLRGNRLTGTIPTELTQLTNLEYLFLRGNRLTGTIPTELAQLTNLFHLDLNGNKLTGTIPTELTQLTNLTTLYLGGNELTGTIPPELLQQLDQPCPALYTGRFCDDDTTGHESRIETIAGWGITQGCDYWNPRYCPEDSITRRQMAAFLHRAVTHRAGTEPTSTEAPALNDVEEGFSLPYIQWAVAAGVMQAPEGKFNPGGTVTRADMAEMITAAFDHITLPAAAQGIFADMTGQPDAVIRAAEALRAAGVTDGCSISPFELFGAGMRYCPDQPVTRAQMASFFARALS